MTTVQSAALRQISSMLQSGALHGGTISQRRQFVVAIEQVLEAANYWEIRCSAAEAVIEESPCDPDVTMKQIEAIAYWEKIKSSNK